jgi:hypothetical protein
VEGEEVRLSDLLPPDAPAGLGGLCRLIILGDAPLIASQRVISRVQIEQQLREFPSLLEWLEVPPRVIVRRKRRRLSSAEIQTAIERFMAGKDSPDFHEVSLHRLNLQAPVFVTQIDAGLEVRRVEFDRVERKTRFLLRASREPQVLPFYVTVEEGLGERADCALTYLMTQSDSRLGFHAALGNFTYPPGWLDSHSSCAAAHPGNPAAPITASPVVLVAAGKPAKLVVETATLRLTAQVTPLQSGVKGQIIRVRNQDTHRVLQAEVVGAGLLQPALGSE